MYYLHPKVFWYWMISWGCCRPKLFEQYARPYMTRIFQAFDDLIKVYHNDTPCPHLLTPMSESGL